jgi:glutathione synthase/RimK-type ligase-like ATP-grasp enzyme
VYTIGIVGSKKDLHVRQLIGESGKKNIEAHVIDFTHFPKYNLLTVSPFTAYDDIGILKDIPVKRLNLLLIRNFAVFHNSPVTTGDMLEAWSSRVRDIVSLQYAFVNVMGRRIPVINHPYHSRVHSLKPYQYYFLHSRGIRVPETLVTTDMKKIRAFLERLDHRVIAKPCASGAEVVMADGEFFEKNKKIAERRPFMYQQFVSGRSFRTYLLGGRIVSSAEIFFDRTFVDWRERADKTVPCTLEEEVVLHIEKAVRLLGLAYCGVDIEYDSHTGTYYLLDFNPSALFTGWSRLVDINMAEKIIDYILMVLQNGNRVWLSP